MAERTHHLFGNEIKEIKGVKGARDNFRCNVSVFAECHGDQETLPMNKHISICSSLSHNCATKSASQGEVILACFISHHQQVTISVEITIDNIPVLLSELFVTFSCDLV